MTANIVLLQNSAQLADRRWAQMKPEEALYENWFDGYLTQQEEKAIEALYHYVVGYGLYGTYTNLNELASDSREFKQFLPAAIKLKLVSCTLHSRLVTDARQSSRKLVSDGFRLKLSTYTENGYLITPMGEAFFKSMS